MKYPRDIPSRARVRPLDAADVLARDCRTLIWCNSSRTDRLEW